jgi:transcriptional regulator with XRE-family HTH domain
MPGAVWAAEAAVAEFAKRVHRARLDAGLSRTEAARELGVDRAAVRRVETGRSRPSFGFLLALADAYDVDPCELVRGLHKLHD